MQIMDPDVNLHSLIDMSMSQAAIADVVDNIDEDFIWLDEILTECKNTFSSSRVNLLPKTPSQKKPPRKRARRRPVDDEELETVCASTSSADSQHPESTSETPVRRLRSTRSKVAQPSALSRVTRSSRTTSRKAEEKENLAPESERSQNREVTLPSVSETTAQVLTSPMSPASVFTSPASSTEGEKSGVRQRARAYENMLSGRSHGSPVKSNDASKQSPKSSEERKQNNKKSVLATAQTEPIECEPKLAVINVSDSSQNSKRCSEVSRRSSAARKRTSLRVLGSKVKKHSMQMRLSVGPHAGLTEEAVHEHLKVKQKEPALEHTNKQPNEGEMQERTETKESQSKSSRTRLRLKKDNKSATESSSETTDSQGEEAGKPAATVSTLENVESSPARSSRTKRKKQKSSSEDEPVQAKVTKSNMSSNEDEGRTRTRTKARKMEPVTSSETEETQNQNVQEVSVDTTADKSSTSSSNENQTRTRTRARKMQVAASTEEIKTQNTGAVSTETVTGKNDSSNSDENQTCTRTKARKIKSTETTSTEETMDTDGTEGSVFESPVPDKRHQSVSSTRLSGKSSSGDVTIDSGVGSTATTKSVGDDAQEAVISKTSSVPLHAAETDCNSELPKPEEKSRRETRVISRTDALNSEEEEVRPTRSTRTKTRQAQNKNTDDDASTKTQKPEEEPRMTRTKSRKRQAEDETAADTSESKRSCIEISPEAEQKMDDDAELEADDDSDFEDIESDSPQRVKKSIPSFLNQLRKSSLSRSTTLVSGAVTSFLKRNTPSRKPTFQHLQEQRKQELLQKEKREQERLSRLDVIKRNKAEEHKKKREERMRKVAEMREMRQRKETDLKKNLVEKLQERLNSTDRMKEGKFKEEREKQKLRLKRQLEADERRRQEEDQRLKKQLEQEIEQKRHEELLRRKREQEEQERQRRQAEELKKQKERQVEAERQRLAEQERLRQQELEREQERQKEKEQKERTAAQEKAERDRQELERKKEREMKIQRELDKLKDLEQQRLARMAVQEEEKRREETRLQQIIQQHNRNLQNLGFNSTLTLTTNTAAATKPDSQNKPDPDSYPITPVRQKKKGSLENYDIGDLKSDDSTDDDEAPRKKIPTWAQGANLKAMLINQVYHPPDLDTIFAYVEPPDLNEMFDRKRARFNKRTSSAIWNSPMHKPH